MTDATFIHVAASRLTYPPLGVMYLSSVLEQNGYSTQIVDYQAPFYKDEFWDAANLAKIILDSNGVIGLSCMSDALPLVVAAVNRAKEKDPTKIIILGGPGPSGTASLLLQSFPAIDIIVRGEAERTIVELLDELYEGNLDKVKGISYRDKKHNTIQENPPREREKDLDSIPFPAYHKLDLKKYDGVTVITSRGCPYNCTFCDAAPIWGRTNIKRSIKNVLEEIAMLYHKYKIDFVHFADDTFVLDKKRVIEFAKKIREEQLDVGWQCNGRINLMTQELMEAMKAGGCQSVLFGIESGSDKVLKMIKKEISTAQVIEVTKKSQNFFRQIALSYIWGFPFEELDDFYQTFFMITYFSRLGLRVHFSRLSLLPQAQLTLQYGDSLLPLHESLELENILEGISLFRDAGGHNEELLFLIANHPKIFTNFYWVYTPHVYEKVNFISRLMKSSNPPLGPS